MSYYRTCPNCGAHLDPGEKCSCEETKTEMEDTATELQLKAVDEALEAMASALSTITETVDEIRLVKKGKF